MAIGNKLKEKYQDTFAELKVPYANAMLNSTPQHLRKVQEYELQSVFHSDGIFLYNCIKELVNNGKLTPPTEDQKKSLITLITF